VTHRSDLLDLISELAVVHGKVTLSSGQEADYYIDLRRITLQAKAAPLVGIVMRQVTRDWTYDAVGGLTLGADPVATAILHASDGAVDAFVVRKEEKKHGMQRRVEGPDVAGKRVLVVGYARDRPRKGCRWSDDLEDSHRTGTPVVTRHPEAVSIESHRERQRPRGCGQLCTPLWLRGVDQVEATVTRKNKDAA